MNDKSRSFNSIKNIIYSLVCQFIYIAITFVNRTVFINVLGAEYTGINGLFSNILTLFSLAELGVGNVMIYSLYKPLRDHDQEKVASLLKYFKNIYLAIASAILGLGIILLPFLPSIVNSTIPMGNVYVYYMIFLLNSVCSYFCAHKITLINADQRVYIVRLRTFLFQLTQNVLQIFILFQTHNFILYLIIQLLATVLTNISLSLKADKLFPFLKTNKKLQKSEKRIIFRKIRSTMLYKISIVIMNNTDNILISALIGTIFVGYYSNYLLVVSTVNTVISLVISALIPSIGNLNADIDRKKQYQIFYVLVLVFQWTISFASIALYFLLNDFIVQWIGVEYLLDDAVLIAIVANFYISNVISPVWMYREATGLFEKVKYTMAIACGINIVLSIVLGKIFGMAGILIATAIARCMTTVWYEPIVLHKTIFDRPVKKYFLRQLKYLSLALLSFAATGVVIFLLAQNGVSNIVVKAGACILVPNIIFYLASRKTDEWKYIATMLKSTVGAIVARRKR